jgi:hypothetical protein
MRASRLLLLLAAVGSAGVAPRQTPAAELVPPFDLYVLAGLTPDALASVPRSALDWTLVHREQSRGELWLLLALTPAGTPSPLGAAGTPVYLSSVHPGERLLLAAPPHGDLPVLDSGRRLTTTPSGATILATDEDLPALALRAPESFYVLGPGLPLPEARPPGPSPRFAQILTRAARVEATMAPFRTTAQVESLVNIVSLDSLVSTVNELSLTAAGKPRSRYWARDYTENEAKLFIADRLHSVLQPFGGTVSSQAFVIETTDTTRVATNIIARLPSATPDAGAILVTAHYDAIGTRTDPVALCAEGFYGEPNSCDCNQSNSAIREDPACAWDWRRDPAPGGNDNATGVALLLEVARALAGVEFDFDLYFVAFQGEELGLLGSKALADSIAAAGGQEIFAVINADEIGYNPDFNQIDVTVNDSSEWLADLLLSAGASFTSDLALNKKVEFFARSDHARFWAIGVDAVLLNEDNDVTYPDYHTIYDTWPQVLARFQSVGRDTANAQLQFLRTVQLVVATLGRLSLEYDDPDLALLAGELEAKDAATGSDTLRTTRPVQLVAKVHNLGSSSLTYGTSTIDTLSASVTFYDGDPAEGAPQIGSVTQAAFFPSGGAVFFTHLWVPPAGAEGFHAIHAIVEGLDEGYAQNEVSAENNEESLVVFLQAPLSAGPKLLALHPYPNPVVGGRDDLHFYYELSLPAAVQLQIYDLHGQRVGIYAASLRFVTQGNQPGSNRISGSDFRWDASDLQSGVYIYAMQLRDGSGRTSDERTGKFALIR